MEDQATDTVAQGAAEPAADPPAAGPPPPGIWDKSLQFERVTLDADADVKTVWRTVHYSYNNKVNGSFGEQIFPIYVPPVPESPASPADGGGAVATTDAYWAKASDQARSTAKWIATILGAALAAIVGTAPLSPLAGKDVDWVSVPGGLAALGVLLLGLTIFMVLAVLVPDITTYGDLMGSAGRNRRPFMSIQRARRNMAERAKAQCGADLPIGIGSLDELGHRVRIEEMTLEAIAKQLCEARGEAAAAAWEKVKKDRAQWLQSLIEEATRWVIVGSYLSVKVKGDRARTIGLFSGLAGGVLVIVGYIALQAPKTPEATTYAVRPSATTATARTALGTSCDVFTAVPIAKDQVRGTVTLYVTGGRGCPAYQRLELPAEQIVEVESSPAPTKTSKSPG